MGGWIGPLKRYVVAGLCLGIATEAPHALPHPESVIYLQAGKLVEDRDHAHRENRAFVKLELSRPISGALATGILGPLGSLTYIK